MPEQRDPEPEATPPEDSIPEPVEMEITDVLDLHHFRPAEIGDLVENYLQLAWDRGLRQVRLIHGKGIGVQRRRVRAILERHPKVLRWGNMPGEAGGWGATWVEMGEEP